MILFNNLKEKYLKCTKCKELCNNRTQVVFGFGKKDANVLFIGEAPGKTEDEKGIPFCGMSGKILDELLQSINLSRDNIFITNTILCRPPNNRNPAQDELENCKERLDELIEILQPQVIVTIGNFATERMIGKTGIKTIRGKVFELSCNNNYNNNNNYIKNNCIKVVPVVHPASYLYSGRNPEMLAQMKSDFQTIAKVIGEK